MDNKLEELLDGIKEQLGESGVDQDEIDDILDKVKDTFGGDSAGDLEGLANLIGRLGRATATGAAGGDTELLKQLIVLLGPTAAGLLDRIVGPLLTPTDGLIIRRDPYNPDCVEIIQKESVPGAQEDKAPRCILVSGSKKIECVDASNLLVRFKMLVTREEEDVDRVSARFVDLTGNSVEGEDLITDGNRDLPETSDQSNSNDTFNLDMVLHVPCSVLFRNGGSLLLRVQVEDDNDNGYIYHTLLDLTEVFLSEDYECCGRYRQEDLIANFLKRLQENTLSVDRSKFQEMIEGFLRSATATRTTSQSTTSGRSPAQFNTAGGVVFDPDLLEMIESVRPGFVFANRELFEIPGIRRLEEQPDNET